MASVLSPALDRADPRIAPIPPRWFGITGVGVSVAGGGATTPPAPISVLPGYTAPTLNARQTAAFIHRCDVWKPIFERSAQGDARPVYWTRVLTNVACRFRFRSSLTEPQLVAMLEAQDLTTADTCKFGFGMPIDDYWILINRNVSPDGTPSVNYGKPWIVRGEPERTIDGGNRIPGQTKAFVAKLQLTPPEFA